MTPQIPDRIVRRLAVLGLVVASSVALGPPRTKPQVDFRTTKLADNLHLVQGAGGNIAVCVGDDGVLLVDCDVPQVADLLVEHLRSLTDKPVRAVINTHWHFDHVGGNERLAADGALIIAHDNVRARMRAPQRLRGIGDRLIPASPPEALPRVTFADKLTLHWGGQTVDIVHVAPAHTDGDSFVHFRAANVLHVGDTCFNGMYPFIDVNAGGHIDGMIAAADRALEIADDDTKIIPGHGPLMTPDTLRGYRNMLVTVRDRVQALLDAGQTRDEIVAARPTADLDADWAKAFGPDTWVGLVVDGMLAQRKQ
jgi:cyclase